MTLDRDTDTLTIPCYVTLLVSRVILET